MFCTLSNSVIILSFTNDLNLDCLKFHGLVQSETNTKEGAQRKLLPNNFTKRQVQIERLRSRQNILVCDSKTEFFMGLVENNVGKGENAGYQHFLLFPKCFNAFLHRYSF